MSNTPETDKAERMAYSQEYMVPTEFARKLERERDEANELLASEKITRNHIIKRSVEVERERDEANEELHKQLVQFDQLFDEAEKIRIERDEAREKAERYRREANKFMLQRDESQEKYATEATEHMLAVNKLCNERDEAQADCLEQARLLGMGSEREARLISERDEAVEEIKEWKTLCLWGGTPEHIHGFIRGQQSRIQHLECERDEARDNIEGWENKWRCAVDMAARAELERDDAFNKLKELKDILR